MLRYIQLFALLIYGSQLYAQEYTDQDFKDENKKLSLSVDAGMSWAYEDKAHLFNTTTSAIFDYQIKNNFYFQFAPRYTWLIKWNEHYLTLPLHIRKQFGKKLSLFAGPALTFDIGYFKDLGISAGLYYHFSKRSAIKLSVFTLTLYDYHIDYLFVPIGLTYTFTILK